MRKLLSALSAIVLLIVVFAVPQSATAAPGDAVLRVNVIKEVNANGAWDSVLEPGIASTTIRVTDNAGTVVTTTTGTAGTATIDTTTLAGGRYRVEVINPKPDLYYPAFASTSNDTPSATRLSSAEEFVDLTLGAPVTVTTGFWVPGDYCQANPTIYNACNNGLDTSGSVYLRDGRSLFSTDYRLTGANTTRNDFNDVGATYGIGIDRVNSRVFQGAYAKRASMYSVTAGQGRIFTTAAAGGTPQVFATVPNAGTTPHGTTTVLGSPTDLFGRPYALSQDLAFRTAVGKESLGDIDVSDDGRFLFAVNMFDKNLYVYNALAAPGGAALRNIPITNPCADAATWRPMGIGEFEGKVYIGGVCDQALTAHVIEVTLASTVAAISMGSSVMNQPLNYARQTNNLNAGIPACGTAVWHAWADDIPATCKIGSQVTWAQPMFADIEFRANGTMLASFRDRSADQYGTSLTVVGGTIPQYVAGGDLLEACGVNGTSFTFDVWGGCGRANTEFFANDSRYLNIHNESYYGGIVHVPSETGVVANVLDPADPLSAAFTDGMSNANVTTAATQADQLVTVGAAGGFGKGQGLADIEALCNLAPIQIGNRVWYDRDKDGAQDAAEPALQGVSVQLVRNGAVIGTRVTNARGEYYFANTDADLGGQFLANGGNYTIRFVKPTTGTVNLGAPEGSQPWERLVLTTQAQGTNRHIDSNPNPTTGEFVYTAGGPGQNDHTIDAGYILNTPRIEYAKTSNPAPGTAVRAGDNVTYSVTASNTGTITATEGTLTDDMSQVLNKATLEPAGAVPVLTCTPTTATCGALVYQAANQRFVWTATPAAPLPAGAVATISYTVKVNAGVTGNLRNTLVEPAITVEHPIITWSKVGTPGNAVRVAPGDTVGYTIGVRNTGTIASASFTVSDDLSAVVSKATFNPASITITPAIGTAIYDPATSVLTWTGALPPGQEVLVSYNATVNADAFGELRNNFLGTEVVNPISAALTWNKIAPDGERLTGSEWTLTRTVTPAEPAIAVVDCVAANAAACTGADVDPSAGGLRVEDLVPGSYQLVETKAPFGFVLLADPIAVTVLDDRSVTTLPDIENVQQDVPALPLTGGLGTDQVLLSGALLSALAGFLGLWQVRRRRLT